MWHSADSNNDLNIPIQLGDPEAEIDQLLALPLEKAFLVIVEVIPRLDNDSWMDYQRRLVRRIDCDRQRVLPILKMSHLMVDSENRVRELLAACDASDAAAHTQELLKEQDQTQQFGMLAYLRYLSEKDAKARAVWGLIFQALLSDESDD